MMLLIFTIVIGIICLIIGLYVSRLRRKVARKRRERHHARISCKLCDAYVILCDDGTHQGKAWDAWAMMELAKQGWRWHTLSWMVHNEDKDVDIHNEEDLFYCPDHDEQIIAEDIRGKAWHLIDDGGTECETEERRG